ncbi:hypothetical protein E0K89_008765 [Aquicoccus sp. SCR17]|nr:hypothetical protein [Carideicomes alvinocaridis]
MITPSAPSDQDRPTQSLPVILARDLRVVNGANLGDPVSFAAELEPGDVYGLSQLSERQALQVHPAESGPFTIAEGSALGTAGHDLHLDCCATFMSGDGATTEALILVEVDAEGSVAGTYLLPLAPMAPGVDYVLVGAVKEDARRKLAQVACVSFTRGTHITLGSGEQRRIEDLKVGDKVLTRDDGVQAIRWIGQSTLRATGAFCPIVITAGTLHNAHDLMVSPDHRLFIYQRSDELGAGRSEVLVKARHLENGETIYRREGGYVDYFQLLFDAHQIIYAEGIAAESLLIDPRTRPVLPEAVSEKLAATLPGHERRPNDPFEIQETLVRRPDAAEILRRSSTR